MKKKRKRLSKAQVWPKVKQKKTIKLYIVLLERTIKLRHFKLLLSLINTLRTNCPSRVAQKYYKEELQFGNLCFHWQNFQSLWSGVWPIGFGVLSSGKEGFSLMNRNFHYFWLLVDCTFWNSWKKRFIHTAFSQLWKMAGLLSWYGALFLWNSQGQLFSSWKN